MVMIGGGIIFIDDKARGLHEGYLVTPITKLELITGFNLSGTVKAIMAGLVVVLLGSLISGIPNPFEPLIVTDQSTDGPLVEYSLKLRAVRAQLEGTPVKVVTTTTLTEIGDIVGLRSYLGNDPTVTPKLTIVQQTQITNVQPADVDPKLFTVPEGGALNF